MLRETVESFVPLVLDGPQDLLPALLLLQHVPQTVLLVPETLLGTLLAEVTLVCLFMFGCYLWREKWEKSEEQHIWVTSAC